MKTIFLYDEIGGWGTSAEGFKSQLEGLNGDDLEIRVNSPGGEVFEGLTMYNLLKGYEGKTSFVVDGVAASIASIVAMGADELIMGEGTFLMIHNPWVGMIGESEDLRKEADFMDKIKLQMVGIYKEKTGLSEETITKMMDDTTWIDSKEAIELGFADKLQESKKIAANLSFKGKNEYFFNKVPKEVMKMSKKEIQEPKAEAEVIEAPAVEEVETPEVAKVEEVETPEIFDEPTVVAQETFTADQVNEKIEEALKAEAKRQKEIKALSFNGQSVLVDELIEEGATIEAASMRIINHAKVNNLLSQPKVKDQVEALKAEAPGAIVDKDEQLGEKSQIERLRADAAKETDPKRRLEITKEIIKLKQGDAHKKG